jgi:transposase
MKFYTRQHKHYCGIDLHARMMYLCVLDGAGAVLLSRNIECSPKAFLAAVKAFRDDLVVAVECMFTWYWLSDLCAREGIGFVLGHALYMRAIHGGKAKNDRIDAHKIAALLRGGMIPQAYVYPPEMRATRDLLRRRNHLMRKRSELITHIQNTVSQYNLPPFETRRIQKPSERTEVLAHFPDPQVRNSVALDLALIEQYDALLPKLERHIRACAKQHDRKSFVLLRSIHGADLILPLVILYEVQDIGRFPRAQEFLSYCRLVKPARESAGKIQGHAGGKIGNAHLKWAFSELATTFLRANPPAQQLHERLKKQHGKGKALSVLAAKLARAVYFMLSRRQVFDAHKFFQN